MFKPEQRMEGGMPETFIGPSVRVQGDFTGEGDVTVEGTVAGNLQTKGDVVVGPQALIEAEVKAQNATVSGTIKGNIAIANSLKIRATANILGDIKTTTLSVEDGAIINGKIIMSKDKVEKAFAFEAKKPDMEVKMPSNQSFNPLAMKDRMRAAKDRVLK